MPNFALFELPAISRSLLASPAAADALYAAKNNQHGNADTNKSVALINNGPADVNRVLYILYTYIYIYIMYICIYSQLNKLIVSITTM